MTARRQRLQELLEDCPHTVPNPNPDPNTDPNPNPKPTLTPLTLSWPHFNPYLDPGGLMARRKRLQELLEDCRIADAVYEDTPERFAELTVLERDDVLLFEHEADHFRSAYSIALVPDRKEVRCCALQTCCVIMCVRKMQIPATVALCPAIQHANKDQVMVSLEALMGHGQPRAHLWSPAASSDAKDLDEVSQVMLVIRGTSSLKEVLTDLAGHLVDFALGGHTHNGMLQVGHGDKPSGMARSCVDSIAADSVC